MKYITEADIYRLVMGSKTLSKSGVVTIEAPTYNQYDAMVMQQFFIDGFMSGEFKLVGELRLQRLLTTAKG